MALLLGIGFVAGVITAVSPCVLPVLPIVLAGGASGSTRRPYAIIAGLIVSFTIFTLSASALLSALHLPQDLLRNIAIALLFVIAATLLVPRLGMLIEAPLARLGRRPSGDLGGGFVLGASLGLVFVPCAGPVLATVSVLAAEHKVGLRLVLLTLFYAAGAGSVLLLIAIGGQRVTRRIRTTRTWWRPALGVIVAAAAFAVIFNLDQTLQTHLGSYTSALQKHTEESGYAAKHLKNLKGNTGGITLKKKPAAASAVALPNYAVAPNFVGISHWLNTPGDKPLTITGLRGKVVLVDFWTYSCINCLRTLPHLQAWYAAYHKDGLQIVGVHTPEFPFEHVLGNVQSAVKRLHVTWPVALDNDYATWNAYSNEYWPADYLVDKNGNVRDFSFGEGDYTKMEDAIRELLGVSGPMTTTPNLTPTDVATPETYLGPERLDPSRYVGSTLVQGKSASYTLASSIPQNFISYGGNWTLSKQYAVAGLGAKLELHYYAKDVYIVLGGKGRIAVTRDGKPLPSIDVSADRLYTVFASSSTTDGLLEFSFPPGVDAYSFTFG
ncbi:MAG TPA: cytochrome c biogenesis protein DipZ [Gaiellaceae bacterium]|nr:cytochrome c biogenesis protein DipZ [Gaiellaceae bacterium]